MKAVEQNLSDRLYFHYVGLLLRQRDENNTDRCVGQEAHDSAGLLRPGCNVFSVIERVDHLLQELRSL